MIDFIYKVHLLVFTEESSYYNLQMIVFIYVKLFMLFMFMSLDRQSYLRSIED